MFYIVENRWQLMADTICGIRYQADECFYDNPAFDFTVNIAAGGAPITVRHLVILNISKLMLKFFLFICSNQKDHPQIQEQTA